MARLKSLHFHVVVSLAVDFYFFFSIVVRCSVVLIPFSFLFKHYWNFTMVHYYIIFAKYLCRRYQKLLSLSLFHIFFLLFFIHINMMMVHYKIIFLFFFCFIIIILYFFLFSLLLFLFSFWWMMVIDVVMNVFVDVSLHCRICPWQGRAFEIPAVAEDDKENCKSCPIVHIDKTS